MLSLAEELLLLALDDDKGTVRMSAQTGLKYGIAGAVIGELLLTSRLSMGEKTRLSVGDDSAIGDDVLDEVVARIRDARKSDPIKTWVTRLGSGTGSKNLQRRLQDRLVDRGILRKEDDRYLWIIPVKHYPAMDSSQEINVREQLRSAVLGGAPAGERTLVLAGLIKASGIVQDAFPGEDKKAMSNRIDDMLRQDPVASEISRSVTQAVAEVVATAVAASTAAGAGA